MIFLGKTLYRIFAAYTLLKIGKAILLPVGRRIVFPFR